MSDATPAPAPQAVLAVSTFYKDFEGPIEGAVLPGTELKKTWVNANGGTNYGVELEMRKGLGLLGAAFDGNIHAIGGAYGFDARVNRTISVSTAAVQEALESVYDADALLAELNRGR